MVTRLGLSGYSQLNYGSFAGKTAQVGGINLKNRGLLVNVGRLMN